MPTLKIEFTFKGVILLFQGLFLLPFKLSNGCNIKTAKELGSKIAEVAKSKNVESVYLDRGANIYHGIIKAIADEARAGGLRL